MRLICLLLLAAASIQASPDKKVSCKDEQGNDVDWWYLYKLPKHYTHNEQGEDVSGLRYLYLTSTSYDKWVLSGRRISDINSIPAQTLQPLFSDEQNVLLAAYNDNFPNGTESSTGGHAKGVVATDGVTGIWLVHSVPKYPSIPDYSYPSNGETYGQNLMCLTLDAAGIEKVGELLIYNEPHYYYVRNPLLKSNELFPSLVRALNSQWRTEEPFQKELELRTTDGKLFRLFGKSPRANIELYVDMVAPALGVNLFVEAWRDGAGNLPDNCDKSNKVYNVEEISNAEYHVEFKTTGDHSKWAVSEESGIKLHRWRIGGGDWICVGDINRQQSQAKRGGGTVCHKSIRVSDNYRRLVAAYETCT